MIDWVCFGETVKDLELKTGLSDKELWAAGFNLDHMDCWCSLVPNDDWFTIVRDDDEYSDPYIEVKYKAPLWLSRLIDSWESYCVGYCVVEYDNRVYLTLHHS